MRNTFEKELRESLNSKALRCWGVESGSPSIAGNSRMGGASSWRPPYNKGLVCKVLVTGTLRLGRSVRGCVSESRCSSRVEICETYQEASVAVLSSSDFRNTQLCLRMWKKVSCVVWSVCVGICEIYLWKVFAHRPTDDSKHEPAATTPVNHNNQVCVPPPFETLLLDHYLRPVVAVEVTMVGLVRDIVIPVKRGGGDPVFTIVCEILTTHPSDRPQQEEDEEDIENPHMNRLWKVRRIRD